MGGGTEAFPELGEHCSHQDCRQLDFLPFTCQACHKVFCLEHRTFSAHSCPKSEHNSRIIVICETCSMSVEKQHAYEKDETALERHGKSGDCDPAKKQKNRPKCPVRRCKELLTFSNTSTCKKCSMKVCLKHRFPSDHVCRPPTGRNHHPLLLAARNRMDCRDKNQNMPPSPPAVRAC